MTIHAEQRVIAYTPAQLYGLVADVEKYPEFLPWCLAARVRRRQRENGREEGSDTIVADLVIGFTLAAYPLTLLRVCEGLSCVFGGAYLRQG